jgi:hypothetical protein
MGAIKGVSRHQTVANVRPSGFAATPSVCDRAHRRVKICNNARPCIMMPYILTAFQQGFDAGNII